MKFWNLKVQRKDQENRIGYQCDCPKCSPTISSNIPGLMLLIPGEEDEIQDVKKAFTKNKWKIVEGPTFWKEL